MRSAISSQTRSLPHKSRVGLDGTADSYAGVRHSQGDEKEKTGFPRFFPAMWQTLSSD